jgi:cytosine/adenosine deaminase-related metal-dependent hydrolase
MQYELLDWLEHVTFPVEAKFADPALAQRVYEVVVPRFINSGVCIFRDPPEHALDVHVDDNMLLLR